MGKAAFNNRADAGRRLSKLLSKLELNSPRLLALTRGGLEVARAIADGLEAHVDFAPAPPAPVDESSAFANIAPDSLTASKKPKYEDCDVVLVDDGFETGALALATIDKIRASGATRVLIAAGIASPEAVENFEKKGVETHILHVASKFTHVSDYFSEFEPVREEQVTKMLEELKELTRERAENKSRDRRTIRLEVENESVEAEVSICQESSGFVIIAADGPTGQIRRELSEFSTLFIRQRVTPLIFRRAIEWIDLNVAKNTVPIALVAEGVAACHALETAASLPEKIRAVVSLGGQFEAEPGWLEGVVAPVLFVIPEADEEIKKMTRQIADSLRNEQSLALVEGKTLNDLETSEETALLTLNWVERFVSKPESARAFPTTGKLETTKGKSRPRDKEAQELT